MDNVRQEITELSSMSQRSRRSSIKISDLSFGTKKSSKIDCKNIFPGVENSWHPAIQGWYLPPHDYGPVVMSSLELVFLYNR